MLVGNGAAQDLHSAGSPAAPLFPLLVQWHGECYRLRVAPGAVAAEGALAQALDKTLFCLAKIVHTRARAAHVCRNRNPVMWGRVAVPRRPRGAARVVCVSPRARRARDVGRRSGTARLDGYDWRANGGRTGPHNLAAWTDRGPVEPALEKHFALAVQVLVRVLECPEYRAPAVGSTGPRAAAAAAGHAHLAAAFPPATVAGLAEALVARHLPLSDAVRARVCAGAQRRVGSVARTRAVATHGGQSPWFIRSYTHTQTPRHATPTPCTRVHMQELAQWGEAPEDFAAPEDTGDAWLFGARPAAQRLFAALFAAFGPAHVASSLNAWLQAVDAAGPAPGGPATAWRLRDAVYTAVGLVADDLYDLLDADAWFADVSGPAAGLA